MKHFASFSEAIRVGAKLRPQAFGALLRDGKSCAYGAAVEAMGVEISGVVGDSSPMFIGLFPYLSEGTRCPECNSSDVMSSVVFHLNDDHKWTRERIADWLESEEEKLGYVTLIETEPKETISERGTVEMGHSIAL